MSIKFLAKPIHGLNNVVWGTCQWHNHDIIAFGHDTTLIAVGFITQDYDRDMILYSLTKQLMIRTLDHNDSVIHKIMTPDHNGQRFLTLYGTPFQHAVWQALLNIPAELRVTYVYIARALGNPSAYRAVGQAVGRNPIAGLVPCHRVIASSGEIGGFRWGKNIKEQLLKNDHLLSSYL